MILPDVHFTNPCFSKIAELRGLGGIAAKLSAIGDDTARVQFGEHFFPKPTDVELTPYLNVDEVSIIMRMWHQTEDERAAVFQPHDTILRIALDGEDAYLKTEEGVQYLLTTREAIVLSEIAQHAVTHAISAAETDI